MKSDRQREFSLNFESNLLINVKLRTNGFFVYELYEAVDGKKLLSSVERALALHPVFKTKLIKTLGKYHLVVNDQKPVVPEVAWNEAVDYGTEEFHEFPWLISYTENKIIFIVAHFLTDGGGQNRFMKTILEYYFGLKPKKDRGEIVKTTREGFKETGISKTKKPFLELDNKECASLPDSFYDFENKDSEINRFVINREDVLKIAHESENTIFAPLLVLSCKAVAVAAGLEEGFVTAGVAVDLRSRYDSKTDLEFNYNPTLNYDVKKFKDKDLAMASTAMRSQLDICTLKENTDHNIARMNMLNGPLRPVVTELARKPFKEAIRGQKAHITFSLVTQTDFSEEVMNRVKSVYLSGMGGHSPLILFHGMVFKDQIIFSVSENSAGFAISKAFEKLLSEENIPVRYEAVKGHGMMVYRPKCWGEAHSYVE